MTFAPPEHVAEMRDLLLQFGAAESVKDRERWELRSFIDWNEPAYMHHMHRSATAAMRYLHNVHSAENLKHSNNNNSYMCR